MCAQTAEKAQQKLFFCFRRKTTTCDAGTAEKFFLCEEKENLQ